MVLYWVDDRYFEAGQLHNMQNYSKVFCLSLLSAVSLASFYLRPSFKRFDEDVDLTGKTVLITNPDTGSLESVISCPKN